MAKSVAPSKRRRATPPAQPTERVDTQRKKAVAVGIFVRHVIEGKTLVQSWREVKPDSKTNDQGAATRAGEMLRWYKTKYPHDMKQAMDVVGVDDYAIGKAIKDLLKAETKNRLGEWEPNWRARADGIKFAMMARDLITRSGERPPVGPGAGGTMNVEKMNIIYAPKNYDSAEEWEAAVTEHNRKVEEAEAKARMARAAELQEQGLPVTGLPPPQTLAEVE